MPKISETISLTNTDQNAELSKQVGWAAFGAVIACILFSIPIGLAYMFVFHGKAYWFRSILLFFVIYLFACVINLMFYRVVIMNDTQGEINKMGSNDVGYVLAITLSGFMIVALTLMGVSANPFLVDIFENTFGYWFLQYFGLKAFTDEIFSSKTMDPIKKASDPNEFNYSFLITRFNLENLEELIQYGMDCKNNREKDSANRLGLDFDFVLKYNEQAERLRELVRLKNTVGHFSWIYLASVVALIVSMVGIIM